MKSSSTSFTSNLNLDGCVPKKCVHKKSKYFPWIVIFYTCTISTYNIMLAGSYRSLEPLRRLNIFSARPCGSCSTCLVFFSLFFFFYIILCMVVSMQIAIATGRSTRCTCLHSCMCTCVCNTQTHTLTIPTLPSHTHLNSREQRRGPIPPTPLALSPPTTLLLLLLVLPLLALLDELFPLFQLPLRVAGAGCLLLGVCGVGGVVDENITTFDNMGCCVGGVCVGGVVDRVLVRV